MPVVKTLKQKREDEYRKRIRGVIVGRMVAEGVSKTELASRLGMTPASITMLLKRGTLSLTKFIQLDELLHFDEADMSKLLKRRLSDVPAGY